MYKYLNVDHKNIKDNLPGLKEYLTSRADLICGYIFGSYASGRVGKLSDFDLGVLLDTSFTKAEIWKAEEGFYLEICDILNVSEVDLVILNRAPVVAFFEIISTGTLFFSNDEIKRTDYEVWVMNRYWDYKPLLNEYFFHLEKRIRRKARSVEREEYQAAIRNARKIHNIS